MDHQPLEKWHKLVQRRLSGFQEETAEIGMARPYDATVLEHPPDLSECCNRLLHVLQHTMQEDGIERAFGEGQGVEVSDRKTDVRPFLVRGLRLGKPELVWFNVDADHFSRCDEGGEVKCDSARAATTVQQGHAGSQIRDKERGVTSSCST